MMTIDVETLRTWLEEGRPVTVLDVRPAAEREEWAIPGSIHVDAYDALQAMILVCSLSRSKPLCHLLISLHLRLNTYNGE